MLEIREWHIAGGGGQIEEGVGGKSEWKIAVVDADEDIQIENWGFEV